MCNKAINSIDSRISTVENHLETLQTELMASLTSIKQKSNEEFNKLNSQVKIKTELNDLFLNEMKQKLDETTTTNTSVDKLFELQACINSINELESFYRVLNRKIRYESSDWMPNDSFICSFFEIFKENK
jgi:archaellum component FlaC